MMSNSEILRVVKKLGASSYKEGKEWNGHKVYVPVYSKMSYVGLPLVIFDDDGELRLSTPEEALDYINATTIFDEEGDPEEETIDRKFSSWEVPHKD